MEQFNSNFKGRSIEQGEVALVYRNLNNGLFSVKAVRGEYKNKVVGHFQSLTLMPVTDKQNMVKLSIASQRRCRESGVRNVHCYLMARIVKASQERQPLSQGHRLTYVPFIHGSFVFADTQREWDGHAKRIELSDGQCFVIV